ncbi:hypothetical protein OnM2_058019, partial [Erysiphe neolycopersici]
MANKTNPNFHQSEMPDPPKNWRELKSHKYSKAFRNAMSVEYNALIEKKTLEEVESTSSMDPIPIKC